MRHSSVGGFFCFFLALEISVSARCLPCLPRKNCALVACGIDWCFIMASRLPTSVWGSPFGDPGMFQESDGSDPLNDYHPRDKNSMRHQNRYNCSNNYTSKIP